MTDIESKLLKNEQIIYHGHKHWIIFFPSVALLIICFSFFIEVVLLQKLVIVPLLLAIITGIGAMISYFLSEIVITNKKVLLKVGFLRRIFVEKQLQNIVSVQTDRGFWGKIFKYGTIKIYDINDVCLSLERISCPIRFKTELDKQLPKKSNQ